MEAKKTTVTEARANRRLDVFLAEFLGCTRSRAEKLTEEGAVTVNGKREPKRCVVRAGDEICVIPPAVRETNITPENIELKIVYEDASLAVIDKPQNMTVHPSGANVSGTLVNALLYRIKDLSGINGVLRPGIVHRLDKDTSGLLVVAKDDFTHAALAEQLKNRTCTRIYLALLEGTVKEDGGTVDKPLARDKKDRKKFTTVGAGGRTARTQFTVIKRFAEHTLCEFKLFTGRTHQIRVHAKYMGHPVVGDKTYGYKRQKFPRLTGQLLHAARLEFTHPKTGERMAFTSPLPDYFKEIVDGFGSGT